MMFDDPILKVDMARTSDMTRINKPKKQSSPGDKDEFQKRVKEKLEHNDREPHYKEHWGRDKVEIDDGTKEEEEPASKTVLKNSKKKATDEESIGPMGHSLDLKV